MIETNNEDNDLVVEEMFRVWTGDIRFGIANAPIPQNPEVSRVIPSRYPMSSCIGQHEND